VQLKKAKTMNMTGNTILITGGSGGIGRALAEAFHVLGNTVIITGRRREALDAVTAANKGMQAITVDLTDKAAVAAFAADVTRAYPALNVLVNNAGIMQAEDIGAAPAYVDIAEETIATNLLAPIRLTAALLPLLRAQPTSTVITVSSGLAFVPMAMTPTYSATKAAIHSYSMSLRQQLKDTTTEVIEIAPPYVRTSLMGDRQANDPRAMPLEDFITEVMQILGRRPDVSEVIVERCKPLRFAAESGKMDVMFEAINSMHV
jgi:uncharacterized oxidoreductase